MNIPGTAKKRKFYLFKNKNGVYDKFRKVIG